MARGRGRSKVGVTKMIFLKSVGDKDSKNTSRVVILLHVWLRVVSKWQFYGQGAGQIESGRDQNDIFEVSGWQGFQK